MHVTVDDPTEDRKQGKDAQKVEGLRALGSKVFTAAVMTYSGLQKEIMAQPPRCAERTASSRISEMVKHGICTRREDKNYELQK